MAVGAGRGCAEAGGGARQPSGPLPSPNETAIVKLIENLQ